MKKILFVCTGNTCRSPMAEMVLKQMLKKSGRKDFKVTSAGLSVSAPMKMNEKSLVALRDKKIKILKFASKQLTEKMLKQNDLIICLSENHKLVLLRGPFKEKVFSLAELSNCCDVTDPFGGSQQDYDSCLNNIVSALKAIEPKIIEMQKL